MPIKQFSLIHDILLLEVENIEEKIENKSILETIIGITPSQKIEYFHNLKIRLILLFHILAI